MVIGIIAMVVSVFACSMSIGMLIGIRELTKELAEIIFELEDKNWEDR